MHELPLASGTEAEVRFRSLEHHVAVLGIIYDKYTSLFDKHMARQRGLVSPLLRAFGWQLLAYLRGMLQQALAMYPRTHMMPADISISISMLETAR